MKCPVCEDIGFCNDHPKGRPREDRPMSDAPERIWITQTSYGWTLEEPGGNWATEEYVRADLVSPQAQPAAYAKGLKDAAQAAKRERHNREGGTNAYERGAVAASCNIEDAIRALPPLPPGSRVVVVPAAAGVLHLCRKLYWRWHTRRALRRLRAKGIKPTMTADELHKLTRE